MSATAEQIRAVLDVMIAMTDTIRVAGRVPSGELYAQVMGHMDIHTYNAIVARIKGTGLVIEKSHELIWVGPTVKES